MTAPVRALPSVEAIDLEAMLKSWLRQLKIQNRSAHTLRNYAKAVESYLTFCDDHDIPRELNKTTLIAFMAEHPGAASYKALTLSELKLFACFIAEEEGVDASGVCSVKAPKIDQAVVPDLSNDEILRMLKVCDGNSLLDRRDKALIALFSDTGLRRAEMNNLQIEDVDLDECSAIVRKGKGAKGRRVHFSEATAALIDRYTRSRKQAGADARFGPLWVSVHGDRLGYNAIDQALRQRALQANVEGFHLHRLRHSMAVNWMARGGSQATGVFPVNESGWF